MRGSLLHRFRWIASLALFAAALVIVAARAWPGGNVMGDYRAFYCAARVTAHGGSPYDAAPVAACEAERAPAPLFTARNGQLVPAPVPGYLVAALIPFALLPFAVSATLWVALTACAGLVALRFLAATRIGSFYVLLVAFAVPLFGISVFVGELPPFALLGVALAAYALAEQRRRWLVPALALTMVEPQVGIAVAAAVCAVAPRLWKEVAFTFAALAAIALTALGVAANVHYVVHVLPAHVYAELPRVEQFSLSWILDRFGVPAVAAITAGKLWYAAMLVAAVVVARSPIAKRSAEFAVYAAAALAVVLGPFVHLDHIVLALPAALWLVSRAEKASLGVVAAAIALALPLLTIMGTPLLILIVPLVAAWIAAYYTRSRDVGLRAAAIATVLVVAAEVLAVRTGTGARAIVAAQTMPVAAQDRWARYVRENDVMTGWSIWAIKLPTWYALAATSLAIGFSIRPRA